MTAKDRQILVAEIIAPHGVNGAVSAESYSDNPRRFDVGAVLTDEAGNRFTVTASARHKGRLLLTLAEATNRDAAEKLRRRKLYAEESSTPSLPEDCFYYYQLIGLTVQEGGRTLGTLEDVLDYRANDVYLVVTPDNKELLIPALRSVVKHVDVAAGVMEVELPDGLLELATPRREKQPAGLAAQAAKAAANAPHTNDESKAGS